MNEITQANATAHTARGCRNGLLCTLELTEDILPKSLAWLTI